LQIIIMTLKAAAFIGLIGTAAIAMFLERIQPAIEKLGEKFEELKLDLYGAIVSYRDGDNSGSQRFA